MPEYLYPTLFSMGGLLAADSLLELARPYREGKAASLWPRIVACLSFDTPVSYDYFSLKSVQTLFPQYLGLQPSVFKNSVTKAAEVMGAAHTVGSAVFGALAGLSAGKAAEKVAPSPNTTNTGWSWAAPAAYAVGGAVLAGAAVGGAWFKREDLGQGYTWATDHMKFVGHLWDEKALQQRVNDLIGLERSHGILFRT